jgi:photosystem II stability/assembly factor-like uncharacterized protein
MNVRRALLLLAIGAGLTSSFAAPGAQTPEPSLFSEMRWRMIGPHRGGRTKASAGIPSRPYTFYIGVVNGGVWKTTDAGRVWTPIFDDQPTGSIGAIAVAPSNPDVIYVGSGEGLQRPDLSTGDGIYKSTDGGRTWTHLGLRDGQQIPQIIVDPANPDRLFVAVLGHPYGPNEERGIFRSTDGARTFQKVLYTDADTGGVDVAFDPTDARIVYAVMWQARQGPWENAAFSGPGSGLFKSIDGGDTWKPLTKGLPTFAADGLGRIGITVAPGNRNRLFATVDATRNGGLYRSDDAGETWTLVNADPRVTERGSDFAEVKVHPANPDIVFTASIVTWKSTDGGRTFSALRGAPGGDDYHRIWINPQHPEIMLIASDQGAIVTLNDGETWSSWYNQPTAQMYHVTTDNAFPYRVCSGQQESGSVCISSRGDDGQITFREWHPVGVEEYGYVAPDPLDPDIVYGGKVSRFDRRTGQVQNVSPPRTGVYRTLRTAPVLFSPVEPRLLLFGSNVVWKTLDGGRNWTAISPDLTRPTWEVPASVGVYASTPAARPSQRGVVYTIAPSYKDVNVIWAGTDDGLIHVTTDGGTTWTNVTPPDLKPWMKVSIMDAGRFDAQTAYAAINTFRIDDLRPHIYRTHDGGRTWTAITNGIPAGGPVNVVREDAQRRGLLFAGTEREVYVSFDDGDRWQSLRLNMPATSIRDLVIKDNDLVVGTHGRSFWILDDLAPLRQYAPQAIQADAFLFKPSDAIRVRWNMNTDTPLPPEEPAGQNPPDGAVIDYHLKAAAAGPITLDVLDAGGQVVRSYSSADTPDPIRDEGNVPKYWIRPTRSLSASAGLHRFVWDLHYPPLPTQQRSYPIAAVFGNTAKLPLGPWVPPGTYTVKLTVNGRSYTQPLAVKMDPRVKTAPADLARQFTLSKTMYDGMKRVGDMLAEMRTRGNVDPAAERNLTQLHGQLSAVLNSLQGADMPPTQATIDAAAAAERAVAQIAR